MQLALQLPNVAYREGPAAVAQAARAAESIGFGWVALNGSAVSIAGARHATALSEDLEKIRDRIRAEVGRD